VHVPELRVSSSAHGLPTPLHTTMAGTYRVDLLLAC
jgi:hypothetical protein